MKKQNKLRQTKSKGTVPRSKLLTVLDTLQQKIDITDLKPLLAADNTSVLMVLATSVWNVPRMHNNSTLMVNREESVL